MVPPLDLATVDQKLSYAKLLSSFPEVTGLAQYRRLPSCDVYHHINTNGQPVYARVRRLPPDKLKVAKAQFEQLVESGD